MVLTGKELDAKNREWRQQFFLLLAQNEEIQLVPEPDRTFTIRCTEIGLVFRESIEYMHWRELLIRAQSMAIAIQEYHQAEKKCFGDEGEP